MSYKALVTLDLQKASESQRETFYEVLVREKWIKIKSLTTAWKILFVDRVSRDSCVETIKVHLLRAKEKSNVQRVDYALQLDVENVSENYI